MLANILGYTGIGFILLAILGALLSLSRYLYIEISPTLAILSALVFIGGALIVAAGIISHA